MPDSSPQDRSGNPWASPGAQPTPPAGPDSPREQAPNGPTPPAAGPGAGTYTFPSMGKQPLEPLAVASLITSPLSPLGLGLGVVALRRIARNHRSGRAFAVWGILLSTVFLVTAGLVVATFSLDGTFARMSETPVAGDVDQERTIAPVNLDVGNCVATLPVTREVGDVRLVPCAEPHQLEVIAREQAPQEQEEYPGAPALGEHAEQVCEEAFTRLIPDEGGRIDEFAPTYLIPSEQNWEDGHRNIICFARST
ncbi:MAG TPA: septum formation family protein, partial [Beutenbergiaceae bacterium]|nr:septum formation family protein [Beutenbergiaceae bacterium]